ncbi:MAG: ribonuclease III [Lachnospiraceae bacterium]|nr:ribonuclease III [Candidatus Merdinaster equi]
MDNKAAIQDTNPEELFGIIQNKFNLGEVDIHTYSPLVLAFIGDGIYDLVVRSILVGEGNRAVEKLHKDKSKVVKAQSQAIMAEALAPIMTQEESDIYRRGRNAKSYTMAKNASMSDYRKATGFEALCGYLYLKKDMSRLLELISEGLAALKENN